MTTKRTVMLNRRHKDIVFEKTGENEITVSGDFGHYYRISCDPETGVVKSFDPEGGPFIAADCTIDHLTCIADRKIVRSIELDIKEGKVILRFD